MRKTTIKNLIHLLIISIPLLLLLVACIFPNKKSENYYNGVETSTSETISSIMFNQLIDNGNFESGTDGWTATRGNIVANNNICTFTITEVAADYGANRISNDSLRIPKNHKLLVKGTIKALYSGTGRIAVSDNTTNYYINTNLSSGYNNVSGIVTNLTNITTFYIGFNSVNGNYAVGDQVEFSNIQLFDLSLMFGLGNEPTLETFNTLYPLDYYEYNTGELLLLHEVETTTTINETSNIVYTQDTKQINTNIIKPINDFYELSINNWYRDTLNLIGINYDNNNIVKTYIAYQPLWLMWFFLFELIEMILTAVPRILIRLTNKISGGGEV